MDYNRMAGTAMRLIRDAGRSAVMSRESAGQYSPDTGIAVKAAKQTTPVRLVTLDYSLKEIDGTMIVAGDVKALISIEGLKFTPMVGDQVAIGADAYRVLNVSKLDPGGTVLLYDAQLRRA